VTGPLASTTGELHPLRSVWPEVVDRPTLQSALLTLEACEQLGENVRITPEMAKAVREYILELREP
jgi:hypothetical protein